MARIVISLLLAAMMNAAFAAGPSAFAKASGRERIFLIEERVSLKELPAKIDELQIWIPFPVSDEWQTVDELKLASPFNAAFITEKEYENRIIRLRPREAVSDKNAYEIKLSFRVQRKECGASDNISGYDENLLRYLKPDSSVPIDGVISKLAVEITRDKTGDLEKVRALYDDVIGDLNYARDDPKVCGVGDSLLTLEHKKGMCTDYHSLFISLVRSLGIPAKFEIGFPLPDTKEEGEIARYHCFAKFYI